MLRYPLAGKFASGWPVSRILSSNRSVYARRLLPERVAWAIISLDSASPRCSSGLPGIGFPLREST